MGDKSVREWDGKLVGSIPQTFQRRKIRDVPHPKGRCNSNLQYLILSLHIPAQFHEFLALIHQDPKTHNSKSMSPFTKPAYTSSPPESLLAIVPVALLSFINHKYASAVSSANPTC